MTTKYNQIFQDCVILVQVFLSVVSLEKSYRTLIWWFSGGRLIAGCCKCIFLFKWSSLLFFRSLDRDWDKRHSRKILRRQTRVSVEGKCPEYLINYNESKSKTFIVVIKSIFLLQLLLLSLTRSSANTGFLLRPAGLVCGCWYLCSTVCLLVLNCCDLKLSGLTVSSLCSGSCSTWSRGRDLERSSDSTRNWERDTLERCGRLCGPRRTRRWP